RLVGYGLSPVLWKKIAFGLSAGRVQSVAVRLICEREEERMRFKKAQYLGMLADLIHTGGNFQAQLLSINDLTVATGKDFDDATGQLKAGVKSTVHILTGDEASKLQESLPPLPWTVASVETKPVTRSPFPPFITSTLQQDASRKFGWSARETMQVAQKLYEQGYITYMRTDSTILSGQALNAARDAIQKEFGAGFYLRSPVFMAVRRSKGLRKHTRRFDPREVLSVILGALRSHLIKKSCMT
ncbi:DNA topoisomerase, partial [sediment metagenome]